MSYTHNLEFTIHARNTIEKTTEDPEFRNQDPEKMFDALMEEIRQISFGDYLKRTIRKKKKEKKEPEETDDLEFLCRQFKENDVPASLTPTSAKLRALARNWMTQRTVNRSVVLLLGFALELTPDEVNELLTKALREPKLDPKDPFEATCWYCYRFRLPYSTQERIWKEVYSDQAGKDEICFPLDLQSTVRVRRDLEKIGTEKQLKTYLSFLKLTDHTGRQSVSAREQFDLLYQKSCELAAKIKNNMEKDNALMESRRLAEELSRNDRLYEYQKREKIRKRRESYRTYSVDEITPADIESILYAAVPKDPNGNLIPMKESLLNLRFFSKRLNRQHISEILEGKGPISRFDIITLSFFVSAGETDRFRNAQNRYDSFIDKTNHFLRDSDMDPLYPANPYESFLLMCMKADDPLGSFSDVWELSYESE